MKMDAAAMQAHVREASRLLGAMANPKRLMILCQLVGGERCVGELGELLGVRQSTVSQHLALLKKDGFVESRRDGQTQYYFLVGNEVRRILEMLDSIYCTGKRAPRKGARS
jgi:DNA-binding transcriptional ArsR family regulator